MFLNDIEAGVAKASGRARWVVLLLGLCIAGDVAGLASGLMQLDLLDRIAAGEVVGDAEATWSDTLYGGVGLVQTAAFVLCAIAWLVWLRSAYGNLSLVGSRGARFTPGWAVGYWFVPFVNLVRPYQILNDVAVRSASRNEPVATARSSNLVALWWFSYLASSFAGRMFFRASLGAEELEGFLASTQAGLVNDAASLLAGVLALTMIRKIAESQRAWLRPAQPTAIVPPAIAPSAV